MPTTLPTRTETSGAIRRLSWLNTVRFVILVARVRWLACHEAIGALLGTAEPSEVTEMRATLQPPKPSVASSENAP